MEWVSKLFEKLRTCSVSLLLSCNFRFTFHGSNCLKPVYTVCAVWPQQPVTVSVKSRRANLRYKVTICCEAERLVTRSTLGFEGRSLRSLRRFIGLFLWRPWFRHLAEALLHLARFCKAGPHTLMWTKFSLAPVSTDSACAVYRGQKKIGKLNK
jgi:hypothetical protein